VMRVLTIEGMDAPPENMDQVFKALSEQLRSDAGKVIVKKGIHQRDTDVHFTLNVYPEPGGAYHVWLKVGSTANVPTGANFQGKVGQMTLFRYTPTGVTFVQNAIMKKWPAAFVYSEGNMPLGRPRGSSISVGNITAIGNTPPTGAQVVMGLKNAPPPTWQPPTV
jgi:hypothetical protein